MTDKNLKKKIIKKSKTIERSVLNRTTELAFWRSQLSLGDMLELLTIRGHNHNNADFVGQLGMEMLPHSDLVVGRNNKILDHVRICTIAVIHCG